MLFDLIEIKSNSIQLQFQLEQLKCTYDHLHFRSLSHIWSLGLQNTNTSKGNLDQFEYIWSLNLNSFSNQLQLKCDKLKLDHIITINIIMCLSIAFYLSWLLCLIDRSATGFGGHPLRWRPRYRISSARQAAPPFDHVDKIPFPSLSLMHE